MKLMNMPKICEPTTTTQVKPKLLKNKIIQMITTSKIIQVMT